MIIKNWSIFHSYNSFFNENLNLDKALIRAVQSGFGEIAYNSDGIASWRHKGKIKVASLNFHSTNNISELKNIKDITDFQRECLYQAGRMHFFEEQIFSDQTLSNIPHVRVFLAPIIFCTNTHRIFLYPYVKIYENGVYSVVFREMSGDVDVSIPDFINKDINLFRHHSKDVDVSPELIRLDAKNILFNSRHVGRSKLSHLKEYNKVLNEIESQTYLAEMIDFEFKLCPASTLTEMTGPGLTLTSLREFIGSALEGALFHKKSGINYLIFGNLNRIDHKGSYWSGRPYAFLLSFSEQPDKASDFSLQNLRAFGRIMGRESQLPDTNAEIFLGKSLRLFDDFGSYFNEAVGLIVYSSAGLENDSAWKDLNDSHLVLPHQIKNEFIDYVEMSYQKLLHTSFSIEQNLSSIMHDRMALISLRLIRRKASTAGEINDLLNYAWNCLKLNEIEAEIAAGRTLKFDVIKENDSKRFNTTTLAITFIFGLVGASGLAKDFVSPILLSFQGLESTSELQRNLLAFSISCTLIVTIIGIFRMWTRKPSLKIS